MMKFKILFFSIIISNLAICLAQAPAISWQRTMGGSSYDFAYSVLTEDDGGFLIGASTRSIDGDVEEVLGGDDIWFIKINSEGEEVWQNSIGGSDTEAYLTAVSFFGTTDGGYIGTAYTYSSDGDVTENKGMSDVWIFKIDSTGEILWSKTMGGSGGDSSWSIDETDDSGFIVVGSTSSTDGDIAENNGGIDAWVIKFDSNGEVEWQDTYGGSEQDVFSSVKKTSDGGYILAGRTDSNDGDVSEHYGTAGDLVPDYWVVKLNSSGNIIWEKSLGGTLYDQAEGVVETDEGNYIVTGYSESTDGNVSSNIGEFDIWVVSLSSTGEIIWEKSLGGSVGDTSTSIENTSDGNYLITGSTASVDGDITNNQGITDAWIIKIDSNGEILWQRTMGGSDGDEIDSIKEVSEDEYIAVGYTFSNDGDVSGQHGLIDAWIVKLGPELMANIEVESTKVTVFPNPIVDKIHFSEKLKNIEINNINGKSIQQFKIETDHLDLSNLEKGIYVLVAESTDGKRIVEKFVKK